MDLSKAFDSFSRRTKKPKKKDVFNYEVPVTIRTKICMYCEILFPQSPVNFGEDGWGTFWTQIHKLLRMRHGRHELSSHTPVSSYKSRASFVIADASAFLCECSDEEFLDFVEDIFKVNIIWNGRVDIAKAVKDINAIFQSESVGYEVTEWIYDVIEEVDDYGRKSSRGKLIALPTIIRKDNQLAHQESIKPALTLLSDPRFEHANVEFLAALKDYKDGDLGDCLTKCCTSFESVMKVICTLKKWKHKDTDTAGPLIQIMIEKTGIDGFFKEPLTLIATIRNRLSTSHGAGTKPKNVEPHIARYAINATAAAIILVVEAAKL